MSFPQSATVPVFISSTWLDLRPERQAVERVIHGFRETKYVGMEYFGSRDEGPGPVSLEEVDRARLYVGIIGGRYGSGITESEYRRARERGADCLIYFKQDPKVVDEEPERRAQLERFKEELRRHDVVEFASPDQLAAQLATDLHRWLFDKWLVPALSGALVATEPAARATVRDLLAAVREPQALGPELLGQLRASGYEVHETYLVTAADREDRQARAALRARASHYAEQFLAPLTAERFSLTVRKERLPDAVDRPLKPAWAGAPAGPEPDHRLMPDVYADALGFLLILGEPGAGKTVALYALSRDLAALHADDLDAPIPVVLSLASWSAETGLGDWLAATLAAAHYVPRKQARDWIDRQRLILLLDGLDEVAEERRAACVTAVNAFLADTGAPGLVVCCRRSDYEALGLKLKLQQAVGLLPLAPSQVDACLADPRHDALRQAIEDDAVLRASAQTPLMLSVMMRAYEGRAAPEALGPGSGGESSEQAVVGAVFDAYVERAFAAGRTSAYSKDVMLKGLRWLAREIQQRSAASFQLESLQPASLTSAGGRWLYYAVTRTSAGLLFVALFLAVFGLEDSRIFQGLGLVMGAGCAVVDGALARRILAGRPSKLRPLAWLAHVLVVSGAFAAISWLSGDRMRVHDWIMGFSILVLPWLAIFTPQLAGRSLEEEVSIPEVTTWRPVAALRGMGLGLLAGSLVTTGSCGSFSFDLFSTHTPSASDYLKAAKDLADLGSSDGVDMRVFCAFCMLLGAVVGGRVVTIGTASVRPNFATRRALMLGLLAGIAVCGLLSGLSSFGRRSNTSLSLYAVPGGLIAFLWYGGFDALRHYLLRVVLRVSEGLPLRLLAFLDGAARLGLLKRVGGSYVFLHRLLLEHLAQGESEVKRNATA